MAPKPKRCRNYDDNGEPTTIGGCKNPQCRFLHPGDREWDKAISTFKSFAFLDRGSFRGRRDSGWSDKRSQLSPTFRPESRDYRDSGPSRRRYSRGSRHSRSPSRSPSRPNRSSSIASSKDPEAGPSRIEAVTLNRVNIDVDSHTNKAPTPLLPPFTPAAMDNVTPSVQDPSTGPNSSHLVNIGRRSSATPILTTSTFKVPSATSPVPPPPPGPAPILPPQPLPELPKTLTLEVAPPQVEQTVEEKFTLWEERIKGFAASVKAQEHLSELEKDINAARVVIASSYFQTLSEGTRALLTVQLMELLKKRDAANEERNRHVESLVQSGYWPMKPPPAGSDSDRLQQDHEEIVKYVKDLHETANEMKVILGEITGLKPPPKLFLPDSSDDELEADKMMDVDEEENHPMASSSSKTLVNKAILPTRKNRQVSQPEPEKIGEQIPTQTELDDVLDSLRHLETMVETLQSDAVEHGREMIEDFQESLSSKAEDIKLKQTEELESRDEKRKKHEAATASRIKSMKQDVGVIDTQVGELAGDIGDMMLKVDRLHAELEKQRGERAESMKRVAEVQRKLDECKANQKKNSDKIETLKLAVKAYTMRPASPPPTPTVPPPAFILQALEEPLTRAVRMSIQPIVEELRNDVEKLIQTKNGELYSTVWDKISGTLRVLEMIRARVSGMAVTTPATSSTTPGDPYPVFH